jgi:hypothetical protein
MNNDALSGFAIGVVLNRIVAHFMVGTGFGCGLLLSLVPFCIASIRALPEPMQKNGLPGCR